MGHPRGRFLALQPAKTGFQPLEITIIRELVMALGGLASPERLRRWRVAIGFIVVRDDKIRCDGGLSARFSWRPKRTSVIFDTMPLNASRLVRSLWCVS